MTAPIESLLTVRRCIHISATPERIWCEFESLERMQAWFGTGHTLLKYEQPFEPIPAVWTVDREEGE